MQADHTLTTRTVGVQARDTIFAVTGVCSVVKKIFLAFALNFLGGFETARVAATFSSRFPNAAVCVRSCPNLLLSRAHVSRSPCPFRRQGDWGARLRNTAFARTVDCGYECGEKSTSLWRARDAAAENREDAQRRCRLPEMRPLPVEVVTHSAARHGHGNRSERL